MQTETVSWELVVITNAKLTSQVDVAAVDEKRLLLGFHGGRRRLAAFVHGGLHARGEPVVWVQVRLHGTFHVLTLLDATSTKRSWVVCVSLGGASHGGFHVSFKLDFGGVVGAVALSILVVVVEERVSVEEHLVDDQDECVTTENEKLGQWEDFLFTGLQLGVPNFSHLG